MKIKILALISVCVVLLACSNVDKKTDEISDNSLGLRGASLGDDKSVELKNFEYSQTPAGESKNIERSYENAPPLIPHSTEGMLDITQDNNMCLSCHASDVAESVGATPVPKSHTYDLRNHKFIKDGISESRYNCTQCHIPQSNLVPLVKNTFTPVFSNEKEKSSSDLLDVINKGVK
ncbi:nitrate reductase cytochrome c-type subunit [Helicobacter cappadocius]|uniref:Periplasmic nitrate reductase, electron transfer subunit n=1 Tax=Helicobacter cappadocius TaxID=3063998 RepID=A0AA90PUI3_9HELI|nr:MULTISPECIES: nitrate reductase cytochrome c-type subunit [unclassified Helicobacter]MDO7253914.1 nitrate reductase cytochrome c-type subunit [Helicobacter sp. faydin-H75]MDP2539789.1 nitrate reductase cytochrome c-type subunit [Helicobacter sp. faydin-H76]